MSNSASQLKVKIIISFLIALSILFVGLIFYAVSVQPIGEGFSVVWQNIWGKVTIADLYLGFFVFGLIYFSFEKSKVKASVWLLLTCVLGNFVPAIFVIRLLLRKQIKV